jgi:hypothetical protein
MVNMLDVLVKLAPGLSETTNMNKFVHRHPLECIRAGVNLNLPLLCRLET